MEVSKEHPDSTAVLLLSRKTAEICGGGGITVWKNTAQRCTLTKEAGTVLTAAKETREVLGTLGTLGTLDTLGREKGVGWTFVLCRTWQRTTAAITTMTNTTAKEVVGVVPRVVAAVVEDLGWTCWGMVLGWRGEE